MPAGGGSGSASNPPGRQFQIEGRPETVAPFLRPGVVSRSVPVLGYHSFVDRLSRKPLLAVLLLYTALILHGTMWPYNFDFSAEFVSKRVQAISWIPEVTDANRGGVVKDVVLNFTLFLPFGVLAFFHGRGSRGAASTRGRKSSCSLKPQITCSLTRGDGRGGTGKTIGLCLGQALLLSAVCETAQIFLPGRFPSTSDMFSDAGGALTGALIAAGIREVATQAGPDRLRDAFRGNLPFLALASFALALLAGAVYTMEPVSSYTEFAARAKTFLWGSLPAHRPLVMAAGPFLAGSVLALLLAGWGARSFPFLSPWTVFLATSLICVACMAGLEALLVLFRTRVPSRLDAFAGALGAVYGAGVHHFLAGRRHPVGTHTTSAAPDGISATGYFPPVVSATLAHYALLALFVFLAPFDFAARNFHLEWRAFVPFFYQLDWPDYSSPFILLRPVAAYLPAGFAYASIRRDRTDLMPSWGIALPCALVQICVEAGRAFTATRHPDGTNVLLAALGGAAGSYLHSRLYGKPRNP